MYYKIYMTLRSDHAWKLIFYFYYIKYAVLNDRIYFRHMNQNINQLFTTDRNQNMIQNNFSLNDEIAENCTIILFDMHKHTQKWWIRIKNKNFDANEHVIRIIDDMWTKNDVRHFNTDWSDVVCKRKNVKIIKFEISHKFIDSCTTVRRTMLWWFVKLFNNYETLKNAKSNTWNKFTIAHRDLIITFRNLFDFLFHYKNILYCFFAIVKFTNFDFLSNALICRKQWIFFAMIKKKDFFLKL